MNVSRCIICNDEIDYCNLLDEYYCMTCELNKPIDKAFERGYDMGTILDEARETAVKQERRDLFKKKAWRPEFEEFLDVMMFGAEKYEMDGWLKHDGKSSDHKSMHSSIMRHVALSFANVRIDDESGLDHLLHVITRATMLYTRMKRGIVHPLDKKVTDR